MNVEFDVKMTPGLMYDFLLQHSYKQPISLIVTAGGCVVLYLFLANPTNWLYFIIALIAIFYLPLSLLQKAFITVKTVPAFKESFHYKLTDEGIEVSQGENIQLILWENCLKACSTKSSILVYTSKASAFIFPRKELEDQIVSVIESISTHMDASKVIIRT